MDLLLQCFTCKMFTTEVYRACVLAYMRRAKPEQLQSI